MTQIQGKVTIQVLGVNTPIHFLYAVLDQDYFQTV